MDISAEKKLDATFVESVQEGVHPSLSHSDVSQKSPSAGHESPSQPDAPRAEVAASTEPVTPIVTAAQAGPIAILHESVSAKHPSMSTGPGALTDTAAQAEPIGIPALSFNVEPAAATGEAQAPKRAPTSAPVSPATPEAASGGRVRKRRVQHVTTLAERGAIIGWMRAQEALGEVKIPSKAVKMFPAEFRGSNNSNLMKASRWFKLRHAAVPAPAAVAAGPALRRKAAPGRGRKKTAWAAALCDDVLQETRRLHAAGVKISNAVVKTVACSILVQQRKPEYRAEHVAKITNRWVQRFVQANPVFQRPAPQIQQAKKTAAKVP